MKLIIERKLASFLCLMLLILVNFKGISVEASLYKPNSKRPMEINSTKEFHLENGLKILIKEDHSAPVFSQSIFYRVGSRNDPKGLSGMSHFLEHMQFNGTATKPKGAISEEIERRGGNFNAATSTDYTMYYMTLPSEHVDFALELEADRMRNSIINPKETERERQVVMSELLSGENNPMTILSRENLKKVYPDHPYGTPIIGWKEDLLNTGAENLKDHYDRFYQPNNAILILVGDVDTDKTLESIKKYFSAIPKSDKAIPAIPLQAEVKDAQRNIEIKSPSETTLLLMNWPGVRFKDEDYAALSVLSAILTNGNLSRLEKALVDSGKASSVGSSMRQGIDPFTFSIVAATSQDGNLNDIEKVIKAEIEKIQKDGVQEDELERVKAKAETSFLFGMEEPSSMAAQLGFFEVVSGDWKRTFYWPQQIESVTAEQVKNAANKYLKLDKATIGKLIHDAKAKGPAGPVHGGTDAIAHENYKPNDLNFGHQRQEEFLTAQEGNVAINKGIQAESVTLSNGLRVILRQNPNLPVIAIAGTVDAGEVFEHNLSKEGISALTGLMLERGSKSHTRDEIDQQVERLGAEIEFSPERDYVSIGAKGRAQDTEKLLELISEQLRFPTFPTDELKKLKQHILSELQQSKDDLGDLGKIAIYQSIYPKDHPYYEQSLEAQIKSVESINDDDLKAFHKSYYQPQRVILSISGDFEKAEIIKQLNKYFGTWEAGNETQKYQVPLIEPSTAAKPITIEVPGKSQASVIIGHSNVINRTDPDFYALMIANDILGGGSTLSSRLGKRVREEAGLVYSIYSSFSMTRGAGPFLVQMGVPPEKIDKAIQLTKEEIVRFQLGDINDEELERAKNYRSGFFISHNLTSNESVASSLGQYALWGLDMDTINEYPNKIKALTKADVVRVSKKYIHPDKLNIVVLKPKK